MTDSIVGTIKITKGEVDKTLELGITHAKFRNKGVQKRLMKNQAKVHRENDKRKAVMNKVMKAQSAVKKIPPVFTSNRGVVPMPPSPEVTADYSLTTEQIEATKASQESFIEQNLCPEVLIDSSPLAAFPLTEKQRTNMIYEPTSITPEGARLYNKDSVEKIQSLCQEILKDEQQRLVGADFSGHTFNPDYSITEHTYDSQGTSVLRKLSDEEAKEYLQSLSEDGAATFTKQVNEVLGSGAEYAARVKEILSSGEPVEFIEVDSCPKFTQEEAALMASNRHRGRGEYVGFKITDEFGNFPGEDSKPLSLSEEAAKQEQGWVDHVMGMDISQAIEIAKGIDIEAKVESSLKNFSADDTSFSLKP